MLRFAPFVMMAVLALVACAAPPPASVPHDAGAPSASAPPMSSPTPPRVAGTPVQVDFSCRSNADCAVKDVGNCCGTMPACVNKASPTDPKAVQAQCAQKGMAGICGFREINTCQCVSNRCEAAD